MLDGAHESKESHNEHSKAERMDLHQQVLFFCHVKNPLLPVHCIRDAFARLNAPSAAVKSKQRVLHPLKELVCGEMTGSTLGRSQFHCPCSVILLPTQLRILKVEGKLFVGLVLS